MVEMWVVLGEVIIKIELLWAPEDFNGEIMLILEPVKPHRDGLGVPLLYCGLVEPGGGVIIFMNRRQGLEMA